MISLSSFFIGNNSGLAHIAGILDKPTFVISGNSNEGFLGRFRNNLVSAIAGGDIGAVTIIGPATIIKEIKRNPKKIELLLKG